VQTHTSADADPIFKTDGQLLVGCQKAAYYTERKDGNDGITVEKRAV